MYNHHQQQHLKTNNIISKLAVVVLSIVLLTGISLVSALQITTNEQVQHQQQQHQQQQHQQQQQQQQHLAFGQAPPEESVEGEQTFRSAFDTFVSSEPGG
jgi:type II secretory pathway pseudopilin PulG